MVHHSMHLRFGRASEPLHLLPRYACYNIADGEGRYDVLELGSGARARRAQAVRYQGRHPLLDPHRHLALRQALQVVGGQVPEDL